jgi:phosphoglucosamine mutase
MPRHHFGTDGIRGSVGKGLITPTFMLQLGWAIGQVIGSSGHLLLGQDTRRSGDMLAAALQTGLTAAGVNVELLGCMPTAGVAYLTKALQADAGIVITASHNPHQDNGVKIFSAAGDKLPDAQEAVISEWLDKPLTLVTSEQLGKVSYLTEASVKYRDFCLASIPETVRLDGLRVVIDCAHGAAYQIAPEILRTLGADVITLGTEPNGTNINDNVGATHPKTICAAVQAQQADVGITLDGDSDRIIMADAQGTLHDGDDILYILAKAYQRQNRLIGNVVGTVMTNKGLEVAFSQQGIGLTRTQVGDRYILEHLVKQGWNLGGESSGHIICRDCTTTGDGIIAALQVLAEMQDTQTRLADLVTYTKYPQKLINIPLGNSTTAAVMANSQVQALVTEAEHQLADQGRVLLRPSGTEPLIRVMVEGSDSQQVNHWVNAIAEQVQRSTHDSTTPREKIYES